MQDHTEQLLDYLHGRLDKTARAEVEGLLASTPALRAELAAITAVQAEMAAEVPGVAERDAGWQRLSQAIEAERTPMPANDNRRFTLAQVAAVAGVAVVCVQMLTFVASPRDMGTGGTGFVPASEAAPGPTLRVGFREDARMAQLTTLLRDLDAVIVDGPGAMGLLTLEFGDADSRDAALAALSERTDLVEIVSQP